jgi:hypothetical protein
MILKDAGPSHDEEDQAECHQPQHWYQSDSESHSSCKHCL